MQLSFFKLWIICQQFFVTRQQIKIAPCACPKFFSSTFPAHLWFHIQKRKTPQLEWMAIKKTWNKQQPLSRSFRNFCLHHQKKKRMFAVGKSFRCPIRLVYWPSVMFAHFFDVMLLNIGKTAETHSLRNRSSFRMVAENLRLEACRKGFDDEIWTRKCQEIRNLNRNWF